MEEPPFQYRLRTIFLLTFAVGAACVVIPILYHGFEWFREFLKQYWWMLVIFGAVVAGHVVRLLIALRRFRDSDL